MMRGLSVKRKLFPLQKLGFTCIIHQMKEIVFHCLSMYFILRIDVLFFTFIFHIHISTNYSHDGLRFWIHVSNI